MIKKSINWEIGIKSSWCEKYCKIIEIAGFFRIYHQTIINEGVGIKSSWREKSLKVNKQGGLDYSRLKSKKETYF